MASAFNAQSDPDVGFNRSALTLAGLVPSAGLSARPAHAAGGTLAQRAFRQLHFCQTRRRCCRKSMPDTAERGNRIMAIFHFRRTGYFIR